LKDLKAQLAKGETDPLITFGSKGPEQVRSIPLLHITRRVCDEILHASLKTTLAEIESGIDQDLKPRSALLTGWKAEGVVTIDHQKAEIKNVIGILEGEGKLADETIVIGAHYDHLGFGGSNSLSPGVKEIHNG